MGKGAENLSIKEQAVPITQNRLSTGNPQSFLNLVKVYTYICMLSTRKLTDRFIAR